MVAGQGHLHGSETWMFSRTATASGVKQLIFTSRKRSSVQHQTSQGIAAMGAQVEHSLLFSKGSKSRPPRQRICGHHIAAAGVDGPSGAPTSDRSASQPARDFGAGRRACIDLGYADDGYSQNGFDNTRACSASR